MKKKKIYFRKKRTPVPGNRPGLQQKHPKMKNSRKMQQKKSDRSIRRQEKKFWKKRSGKNSRNILI